MAAACSGHDAQSESDVVKMPQAGGCFYKADFLEVETGETLQSNQVALSINRQLLKTNDISVISITAGNEIEGRIYFELNEQCERHYDALAKLIAGSSKWMNHDIGVKVKVTNFSKSNWFEMTMRYPDIQQDFGENNSYFEPGGGSCLYLIDVVEKMSGHPIKFEKFYNEARSTLVLSTVEITSHNFVAGRAFLKLEQPCEQNYEMLSDAVSDIAQGEYLEVARFSKSSEAEYKSASQ